MIFCEKLLLPVGRIRVYDMSQLFNTNNNNSYFCVNTTIKNKKNL